MLLYGGSLKSVKLLLDNGADINIRNQEGEMPLSCAKRLGENEIVALLLKYGVTEDNK
uniref:ankyrin repeat domain-containing protein n=1 Tax=Bacteroides stercoris TaxID=46506 RepID=UPI00356143B6